VLPDPSPHAYLEQLLKPIEVLSPGSLSTTSYGLTVGEFGGRNGGHSNTTTSELGSLENPILIDMDCKDGDTKSEPGSAQCPILIEDQDPLPESEDMIIGSDSGSSAEYEMILPLGLSTQAQQQDCDYGCEDGAAAHSSGLQYARGQDKLTEPAVATGGETVAPLSPTVIQDPDSAPNGDTSIEPITMTRGASHSTDTTLTDRMEIWAITLLRLNKGRYSGEASPFTSSTAALKGD
jgi:hypothetical protein